MKRPLALFALLAMSSAPSLVPGCAKADGITGQHALYKLILSKLRTHDITGATGEMRFDVVDGCTGWATTQHMTLILRNVDGSLQKSVTDYITWESKDGKTLTFTLRESDNDGKEQIDDAGIATHKPDGSGIVSYTTPASTQIRLPPGTLFPMQHTNALLAAGRQGQVFISPLLFDGTSANGADATFVTILGHHGPETTPWAALNTVPSTDVDIAFFDRKNDDENPGFRSSMRYFDDGVATNMVMDFGDFVMNADLTQLAIPASPCGK